MYNIIVIHLYCRFEAAIILKQNIMTWNEFRKLAEKGGWRLHRNGANHDIYRHPEKAYSIQIGRHGKEEIKKGTFQKLKKQVGL